MYDKVFNVAGILTRVVWWRPLCSFRCNSVRLSVTELLVVLGAPYYYEYWIRTYIHVKIISIVFFFINSTTNVISMISARVYTYIIFAASTTYLILKCLWNITKPRLLSSHVEHVLQVKNSTPKIISHYRRECLFTTGSWYSLFLLVIICETYAEDWWTSTLLIKSNYCGENKTSIKLIVWF